MDLSSHGRKRSSKDADDVSERDDEREQKRRMQSDESEHTTFVDEKEKKDTVSIETQDYKNPPEYDSVNVLPHLFQHSSFHPMSRFPSPYDLSMSIHELRKPESYQPRAEMPPPFSSLPKPYLQRKSASQVFPSPQVKATQMHFTYSSQQEFLPVLSSSQETKLVSSTVTSSTSSSHQSLSSTAQHQQPSHPVHFHKGSLIQLASGQTKKVEELETEDFISSARSNPDVTIDHSTLVKIETDAPGCVALTFCVGKENLLVTVSAAEEHPFFFFGSSWSSITPALSMARYSLSCAQLSVGDVCISLTNSTHSRQPMLHSTHNREDMTETLQVPSPHTGTSVGSESLSSLPEILPIPTTSVSESSSVTYSVSRPSSSSSELSVTVSVATGFNTSPSKSDENKCPEKKEYRC